MQIPSILVSQHGIFVIQFFVWVYSKLGKISNSFLFKITFKIYNFWIISKIQLFIQIFPSFSNCFTEGLQSLWTAIKLSEISTLLSNFPQKISRPKNGKITTELNEIILNTDKFFRQFHYFWWREEETGKILGKREKKVNHMMEIEELFAGKTISISTTNIFIEKSDTQIKNGKMRETAISKQHPE